jgi:hypothetical protein
VNRRSVAVSISIDFGAGDSSPLEECQRLRMTISPTLRTPYRLYSPYRFLFMGLMYNIHISSIRCLEN